MMTNENNGYENILVWKIILYNIKSYSTLKQLRRKTSINWL